MSINRYNQNCKEHILIFKSISEFKIRKINIFLLFFGICLSAIKIFQYEINFDDETLDYPSLIKDTKQGFYPFLILVHDFFNLFLLNFINTVEEILITCKLHK
jgi:hypothetical protein